MQFRYLYEDREAREAFQAKLGVSLHRFATLLPLPTEVDQGQLRSPVFPALPDKMEPLAFVGPSLLDGRIRLWQHINDGGRIDELVCKQVDESDALPHIYLHNISRQRWSKARKAAAAVFMHKNLGKEYRKYWSQWKQSKYKGASNQTMLAQIVNVSPRLIYNAQLAFEREPKQFYRVLEGQAKSFHLKSALSYRFTNVPKLEYADDHAGGLGAYQNRVNIVILSGDSEKWNLDMHWIASFVKPGGYLIWFRSDHAFKLPGCLECLCLDKNAPERGGKFMHLKSSIMILPNTIQPTSGSGLHWCTVTILRRPARAKQKEVQYREIFLDLCKLQESTGEREYMSSIYAQVLELLCPRRGRVYTPQPDLLPSLGPAIARRDAKLLTERIYAKELLDIDDED